MSDVSPGRKFYDEQIAYLVANDVDGLVDNHYHEDASLIGFDFVVTGREALREQFRNYLKMLGGLTLKSTDKFNETPGTIFFQATITTGQGDVRVFDAFVIDAGKIKYHFTGVL